MFSKVNQRRGGSESGKKRKKRANRNKNIIVYIAKCMQNKGVAPHKIVSETGKLSRLSKRTIRLYLNDDLFSCDFDQARDNINTLLELDDALVEDYPTSQVPLKLKIVNKEILKNLLKK